MEEQVAQKERKKERECLEWKKTIKDKHKRKIKKTKNQ